MSNMLQKRIFTLKWLDKKIKPLPLFVALPDTGLVSLLTAANIINQYKLPIAGYVDADWLPPMISILEGKPLSPVRLYVDEKILILISEVPIYPENWSNFSQVVLSIYDELALPLIIGATGLPNPKRHNLDKLRLFASYTDKSFKERYLKNVNDFSGLLAGPYASLLRSFLMREISAILLIVDSFPNYPDPEAAALVTDVIGRIVNKQFDVNILLKKASEIKLMARRLAAETQRIRSAVSTETGRPPTSFYV
ncbi:hypothetical protein DRN86_02775 [Candidatus Geothermarchaeota archaeon]|nr:MAG: hypothetical protein DRN86_02775 [Candidatus Geothermarchaeota archaeon]